MPFISNSDCGILTVLTPGGANPVQGNVTAKTWIEPAVPQYKSNPFVARHFQIEPEINAASATGKITLFFAQADFDAFNAHPNSVNNLPASPNDEAGKRNLRIAQFHGTSNDGTGLPGSFNSEEVAIDPDENDISWNSDMARWEVSFNVNGFSNFLVHTSAPALPVTLLDFRGEIVENSTKLYWSTMDEVNSKGFSIERSVSGKDFRPVGFVDATETDNAVNKYTFADFGISAVNASRIYYRLKMIDKDDSFAYSKIISVSWSDRNNNPYPNPSAKSTSIKVPVIKNETVIIKLINSAGSVVSQQHFLVTPADSVIHLPVEHLSAGNYVLDITGESFSERKRFVKM